MPSYTFYKAPTNTLQMLRGASGPGVLEYIAHLEKLDGLEIRRFHYIPTTDELSVTGRYAGHDLHVWMEWGGDLVLGAGDGVPEDVFRRACEHMKAYRPVSRAELAQAQERFKRIAKPGAGS